jgi:hypothetical protein
MLISNPLKMLQKIVTEKLSFLLFLLCAKVLLTFFTVLCIMHIEFLQKIEGSHKYFCETAQNSEKHIL